MMETWVIVVYVGLVGAEPLRVPSRATYRETCQELAAEFNGMEWARSTIKSCGVLVIKAECLGPETTAEVTQ